MNQLGIIALVLSICAFALTTNYLRLRSSRIRCMFLCAFTLLSLPSVLFAAYYLHILPERAWFYTLRSWAGTEFLLIFLGCAVGTLASLLPRVLLGVPLFILLTIGIVPFIKPLIGPIPDSAFRELWQGDTCLQSTASTCGPASVATILRQLGSDSPELAIARASFSYTGGTEAWYLARYVRTKGFVPSFDFRSTFSPAVGFPSVVGVRLGGAGHFIAVLDISDQQVTFADPLSGASRISLTQFEHRYQFTGFHMVITKKK